MSIDRLLAYLDIEDPSEFIYFEVMADLIEADEDIDQEAVFALFSGADMDTVNVLFENWFEETLDGLPPDSNEIYGLLHQIKMFLTGLSANAAEESDFRRLADEFCRFRNWYSRDSHVELLPEKGGDALHQCLRDAITTARIEKLGGETYRYNYEDALDYPLDSYTMSFAELIAAEGEDEEEDMSTVDGERHDH